ncbi:hypothetical protein BDV59DRAFT_177100 [Aspergillus ambiguus]|uniref:uncharacterized protein n=1 Tax=Aspergillus ambiguus TaxID=176160 RepID=UPI003CCD77FA
MIQTIRDRRQGVKDAPSNSGNYDPSSGSSSSRLPAAGQPRAAASAIGRKRLRCLSLATQSAHSPSFPSPLVPPSVCLRFLAQRGSSLHRWYHQLKALSNLPAPTGWNDEVNRRDWGLLTGLSGSAPERICATMDPKRNSQDGVGRGRTKQSFVFLPS